MISRFRNYRVYGLRMLGSSLMFSVLARRLVPYPIALSWFALNPEP